MNALFRELAPSLKPHNIFELYKFNSMKGGQKKEILCVKYTGKEMYIILQVFPILLQE
jgi:hypothetical protein